ncbi:MAG: alpha-1,2-fucosyltransferase [Candidatus Shapirobacteria bacterium]|nr:alpha-1,2-fucosyltransferase [Candidatus Shapirobacteria bacterium]
MFQYATGLSLAFKNNDELLVDNRGYFDHRILNSDIPRKYGLNCFNISAKVATYEQIQKHKYPLGFLSKIICIINKKVFRKYYLDFHPEILDQKGDIYLEGFFQSEKNFLEIRPLILKEFTLKKEIFNADFLAEISQNDSVAVHIRRGDYITDKKTKKYHGTCTKEYYFNAIEMMKHQIPHAIFYFFSDDINWVRENFNIDNVKMKIGTDPNLSDCEELILMSKCKHQIIANSSFSWWGAWLNNNKNKIVMVPSKWMSKIPDPHPNIIPKSWTTVQIN